ncbi:hypothetical protein ABEB36_011052 [Hypothenemus hampei]|uniref:Uncharacterized protein n=1 Tax=Hypothenemus hampei TaxID=57062 RepID=A0ABD1EE07_HYPHA
MCSSPICFSIGTSREKITMDFNAFDDFNEIVNDNENIGVENEVLKCLTECYDGPIILAKNYVSFPQNENLSIVVIQDDPENYSIYQNENINKNACLRSQITTDIIDVLYEKECDADALLGSTTPNVLATSDNLSSNPDYDPNHTDQNDYENEIKNNEQL